MLQFIYPVDVTIVLSFDEYLESPDDINPEEASSFNVLIESRKDIHLVYASIDNTANQFDSTEINNLLIRIHVGEMVFYSIQAFEEWYDTEYIRRRKEYFAPIKFNSLNDTNPLMEYTIPVSDFKDI